MVKIYQSPINYGVNTCHAPLLLRKDLIEHLRFLKEYCGFKVVRCHGILNDTIGVATRANDGTLKFHFEQAHKVYANLLDIGYTPMVELSFLPKALALDLTKTCCYYTSYCSQPKSYQEWGNLMQSFGNSLVKRFGIKEISRWRFEVWNEPNLPFWQVKGDSFTEYMRLYEAAARALKKVSQKIKVGGPVTARADWIERFIIYCRDKNLPLDFIETHLYPADEYELYQKKARQYFGPFDFFPTTIEKTNERIRQLLPGTEIIWGEWSAIHRENKSGSKTLADGITFWDAANDDATWGKRPPDDGPFAGVWAAKVAGTFLNGPKMYWWVASDVHEEWGWEHMPYHGGRGLVNLHGIPKPSAHAHHFAYLLDGGRIIKNFSEKGAGFISVRKDKENLLLFWNFCLPELTETNFLLDLKQTGFNIGERSFIYLVDKTHSNGRKIWENLGSPAELNPATEAEIRQGSKLVKNPLPKKVVVGQKLLLGPNAFGLIISPANAK